MIEKIVNKNHERHEERRRRKIERYYHITCCKVLASLALFLMGLFGLLNAVIANLASVLFFGYACFRMGVLAQWEATQDEEQA